GSILASFINAAILLVAMGSLGWEAIQRLQDPAPIAAGTVMVVAAVGVLINALTAALFMSGGKTDMNIRGAFLHMAADALVSLGVIIAGALYLWQGWAWIDPVMSLAIAVVIVAGTWSLFKQSLHLLFDGVPDSVDLAAVRQRLLGLSGIADVHDLHVWAMGTAQTALSAHVVLKPQVTDSDAVLQQAGQALHTHFDIRHVTLQMESADYAGQCALRTGSGCH
ncbi:MAG: cation diffusion facilitator family transporter, partial [Polaromonas sp.]|nr:cation diffusion facilitator family transporter [Polaromonas sp.]